MSINHKQGLLAWSWMITKAFLLTFQEVICCFRLRKHCSFVSGLLHLCVRGHSAVLHVLQTAVVFLFWRQSACHPDISPQCWPPKTAVVGQVTISQCQIQLQCFIRHQAGIYPIYGSILFYAINLRLDKIWNLETFGRSFAVATGEYFSLML